MPANHPITQQYDKMRTLVAGMEPDVDKADSGNHAAGVRVRKGMQELKTLAQGIRETLVLK